LSTVIHDVTDLIKTDDGVDEYFNALPTELALLRVRRTRTNDLSYPKRCNHLL